MQRNILIKQTATLGVLAAIFVGVSYLAHTYQTWLADLVYAGGIVGAIGFIALTAVFVVFVIPLDLVFLIPIGAVVWGPIPTALMSITGWTLGSGIAFGIGRVFGIRVVEKLIGLERARVVERRIPKHNLFGTVILLRMLVSIDILSYALGLFTTMPWRLYILATVIGVTPFGFYFAYAGTLPFWYQIAAVAGAVMLASIVLFQYGIQREP